MEKCEKQLVAAGVAAGIGTVIFLGIFGKVLSRRKCSMCNNELKDGRNYKKLLIKNYEAYKKATDKIVSNKYICSGCFNEHKVCCCQMTKILFFEKDNLANTLDKKHLGQFTYISKEGKALLDKIEEKKIKEKKRINDNLSVWVGSSDTDKIQGYVITENKGIIIASGETLPEAEEKLKYIAAKMNANAYIKFDSNKKTIQTKRKEIEGYGPRGKPYFEGITEKYIEYSVSAYAVYVIKS